MRLIDGQEEVFTLATLTYLTINLKCITRIIISDLYFPSVLINILFTTCLWILNDIASFCAPRVRVSPGFFPSPAAQGIISVQVGTRQISAPFSLALSE